MAQTLPEGKLLTPFRSDDRIVSPTFPQLNLTAQQIFDSFA